MYRDKDKLAINVAKLYYRSDFSQQKIAQELGVSRPSISRLLQYAKDKGYVNIQIVDPVEDMSIMEQRLKDKLHLKDVKIASSTINDEEEIKKYISIAAAQYLDGIIKDGDIIVKDIFTYKQRGLSSDGNVVGEFGMYKRKPLVYDKMIRKGLTSIKDIFE